ncbi:MAG: SpoIVB peptidase S55 domain-containing protein, partial [Armatimonadota bacterium]
MTKLRLALLLPLLSTALALCAAAWPATAFDPQTMMDVNEIQRGARAVGKTVFAGTEIVDFRLEIIDIMSKANLGSDMILARVLDGPVVARQSGIIGGMSGSPVYINGRLIGAVAWGWGFAKEPITGITPIRAMLGAMDMMDAPDTALAPSSDKWRASQPFTLDGARFTAAQVLHPGEQAGPGVLGLYPVSTPLNCNGMGPRTLEFAREKLARFGAMPCAGGGGTATPVPVDLVPGAAVGVRFMEGDFDMTGIGTVTYRKDDKLIAFGHPMMQLGNVNLPLSTAWINDFMPSYEHSNKMGSGMTNVGTLRADMPFAIGGQIGPTAPLIPAHIEIVDTIRKTTRDFNIRVMREHALTPLVLAMGISSAFEAAYNPGRPGVVRTHFELKGEGGATIRRDNQFYMEGAPAGAAMGEVQEIMGLLEDNRWQPQGIAGISYRAEITEKDETALIERVYVEENVAKAGKPIHIHVLLRPTGGQIQDEVFTLNMPLDLPKGSLRIAIGGGQDSMYFRSRLGLMVPDFDGLSPLLDYVEKLEQGKQLCVMAALPSSGLAFGTTRLM